MGLDPVTKLGIGSVGSSAIAPLFAPEGQEIRSFQDHAAEHPDTARFISPVDLLLQQTRGTMNLGQALTELAEQPIDFSSAVVQSPETMSGPDLLFDVGGGGVSDPALQNPDSLILPGKNLGAPFHGAQAPAPGGGGPGGGGPPRNLPPQPPDGFPGGGEFGVATGGGLSPQGGLEGILAALQQRKPQV